MLPPLIIQQSVQSNDWGEWARIWQRYKKVTVNFAKHPLKGKGDCHFIFKLPLRPLPPIGSAAGSLPANPSYRLSRGCKIIVPYLCPHRCPRLQSYPSPSLRVEPRDALSREDHRSSAARTRQHPDSSTPRTSRPHSCDIDHSLPEQYRRYADRSDARQLGSQNDWAACLLRYRSTLHHNCRYDRHRSDSVDRSHSGSRDASPSYGHTAQIQGIGFP